GQLPGVHRRSLGGRLRPHEVRAGPSEHEREPDAARGPRAVLPTHHPAAHLRGAAPGSKGCEVPMMDTSSVDGAARAASADPVIEITDLTKSFGAVEVLKGISTTVAAGEVVCVIGASGSGK